MSDIDNLMIGRRVRAARLRVGLAQKDLAAAVGRSLAWVEKVEGNRLAVTDLRMLYALADALSTEAAYLLGVPYLPRRRADDAGHRLIPAIERVVLGYDLPGDSPPRPMDDLRADLLAASRLRLASRNLELAEMLPRLLEDLQHAANSLDGAKQEEAFWLLAMGYQTARRLAHRLRFTELTALLVERMAWAAERAGDPLLAIQHAWERADLLLLTGNPDVARRICVLALDRLEDTLGHAQPQAWEVWGALQLRAAVAAARVNRAQEANDHVREATKAARRVGVGNNAYQMVFGTFNVAVHRVAVPVELGQGALAVRLAHHVRPAQAPSRERYVHHLTDLARGYHQIGSRDRAIETLLEADRLAPSQVRNYPPARHLVGAMLDRSRTLPEGLRTLCRRMELLAPSRT
ncbi:MAG: hypothetical protein ACRDPT_08070 [Streptomycetales bacterium]